MFASLNLPEIVICHGCLARRSLRQMQHLTVHPPTANAQGSIRMVTASKGRLQPKECVRCYPYDDQKTAHVAALLYLS